MSEKKRKKEKTPEKEYANAEKPVTLHGPKFVDVLKALLETKPMPKNEEDNDKEG